MSPDIENRIQNLERDVEKMKYDKQFQLNYPVDDNSKKILREIISEKIIDIEFEDFVHFSISEPTALSGGQAYALSETNAQITLSIRKKSRFRAVFNVLTLGSSTQYITTTHVRPVDATYTIPKNTGEFVGIKITSAGVMSAMTYSKGSSTEVVIKTGVATGDDYIIEIIVLPQQRADFTLNGVLVASIKDTLPMDSSLEVYDWVHAYVTAGTTNLDIQRLEFVQQNI